MAEELSEFEKRIKNLYDMVNRIYTVKKFFYKNKYKDIVAIKYDFFEPMECEWGSSIVCKDRYKEKLYLKNMLKKSEHRIVDDAEFDTKIKEIKSFEPLKWDRIIYDFSERVTDVGEATITFIFKCGVKCKITNYTAEKESEGWETIWKFVCGVTSQGNFIKLR